MSIMPKFRGPPGPPFMNAGLPIAPKKAPYPVPNFALPLIRKVFPDILASTLISVQPMSLPTTGLIFSLDYQYQNRARRAKNRLTKWMQKRHEF